MLPLYGTHRVPQDCMRFPVAWTVVGSGDLEEEGIVLSTTRFVYSIVADTGARVKEEDEKRGRTLSDILHVFLTATDHDATR